MEIDDGTVETAVGEEGTVEEGEGNGLEGCELQADRGISDYVGVIEEVKVGEGYILR